MHGGESPDHEGIEFDTGVHAREGAPGTLHSNRVLLRRILIYLPGSIVPAMITLLTSMIFTRTFTAAEFGMFSLATVVIAIPLKIVSTTWIVQSVAKFLPPAQTADSRRRTLEAILLAVMWVSGAQFVLGAFALFVGKFALPEEWKPFLVPVVLFIIAATLFEILSSVLTADARATEFTFYQLADSTLTLALRLLMVSAAFQMDVTLMVWSVVISNGVLVPLMWWRTGLPRPGWTTAATIFPNARKTTLSFVSFGFPMTLWLLSGILLGVGDRWILKILMGSGAVGIYDANYRLVSGVVALLVVPVTVTVHPYLMGLSGVADHDRVGQVLGSVVDNLVILAVLAVGVTWVLHQDIALVLLGPEFREGSIIMTPVIAGIFLGQIGTFAHKPFEIIGRTRPMVVMGFLAAAANAAFCFALIPALGYLGAAYATLLAYLLYTVVIGALGRRIISWHLEWKRLLRYTGFIVACVGLIVLVRSLLSGNYLVEFSWVSAACGVLTAGVLSALTGIGRRADPSHADTSVAGERG